MIVLQVNSIPLKDVIISLAEALHVPYQHRCNEYYLNIPEHLGRGEIRGINFENGLGLIIYKVIFKDDIRLEFTLDEVHPVKFIYSLQGFVTHEFANENVQHSIEEYRCAIVASERRNGHIIEFKKDLYHEMVSVEIDRKTFTTKEQCELERWNSKLKKVLMDVNGEKAFYHVANCGIFYKSVLNTIDDHLDVYLAHKLNLQAVTVGMFVNQIIQFDDDRLRSDKRTVLRVHELKRIEEASHYIKENITRDLSVKNISRLTGLNPNKLQSGFRYFFSCTMNEFVNNIRLDEAKILLENKEYNVNAVVAVVGLQSSSYFSKIFKQKFGISPKNYKKLFR